MEILSEKRRSLLESHIDPGDSISGAKNEIRSALSLVKACSSRDRERVATEGMNHASGHDVAARHAIGGLAVPDAAAAEYSAVSHIDAGEKGVPNRRTNQWSLPESHENEPTCSLEFVPIRANISHGSRYTKLPDRRRVSPRANYGHKASNEQDENDKSQLSTFGTGTWRFFAN